MTVTNKEQFRYQIWQLDKTMQFQYFFAFPVSDNNIELYTKSNNKLSESFPLKIVDHIKLIV